MKHWKTISVQILSYVKRHFTEFKCLWSPRFVKSALETSSAKILSIGVADTSVEDAE